MAGVRTLSWASLLLLSGAVAAALLAGPASAGAVPRGPPGPLPLAPSAAEPGLTVDPDSWWTEAGGNVSLQSAWSGAPASCRLAPIWFRWSIGGGTADGDLETENASATVFVASADQSGTTTVVVRSAATVTCGDLVRPVFASSSANVTVAAPIQLRDLEVAPDPAPPGTPVTLSGAVAGGTPPYALRISWGDGTVASLVLPGAGPFSSDHVYGNGSFAPSVLASDSRGWTGSGVVQETENVTDGFAVAIRPSTPIAEVGIPVRFATGTVGAPAAYSSLFLCPGTDASEPRAASGPTFSCTFAFPTVAAVRFEAVGSRSPFPEATAVLDEPVVPSITVALTGAPPVEEVGLPAFAPVQLAGGVPPFDLSWSLVGADWNGSETVAADGTAYVPLQGMGAGTGVLSVEAVDALGVASPNVSEEVPVAPPLEVVGAAAATSDADGVAVNVSATVTEGAPPFDWAVVPDSPAANGSAVAGFLPTSAGFSWNGTVGAGAAVNVTAIVVDAAGAIDSVALVPTVTQPLSVAVAAIPYGSGEAALTLTFEGGLPPYRFAWTGTDGTAGNGTSGAAGGVVVYAQLGPGAPVTFSVQVVDALGAAASASSTVSPTAAAAAASIPVGPIAAVAMLAVGGVAAALWLLRRRRPAPAAAPVDPVAVLRELLEPCEGADRSAIELLAEEQGVPLERVRETVERLKTDGRVIAERGPDGEELLTWSNGRRA